MNDDFYAPEYRKRRQASMLVALVAGALALAALLWLWQSVRSLDDREQALRERMDALAQREEALGAQAQVQAQTLASLSGMQGGIAQRLDVLDGARRSGLLATESEYLSRLAAQRLALAHDADGALALLASADAALRDIRDADVHAARNAIAADSARLREVAALDVEAAYLRLAALPAQVERLALADAPMRATAAEPPLRVAADADAPDQRSAWQRLGDALATLVSVRRVDAAVAPLVTRGERQFAVQNFRLLIEQAQLALLQRQGGIYRNSLLQAGDWLDRLASGDPVLRHAVRRELSALQSLSPDAAMPSLDASLAATRTLAVRLMPDAGAAP
jgi:uroporphyrin-3 C-methyltransferase